MSAFFCRGKLTNLTIPDALPLRPPKFDLLSDWHSRYGFHESVAVELVEGQFTLYGDAASISGGNHHLQDRGLFPDAPPLPGTSIGQSLVAESSGTLGCYLKASRMAPDGATVTKYLATTCHHVLQPGSYHPFIFHFPFLIFPFGHIPRGRHVPAQPQTKGELTPNTGRTEAVPIFNNKTLPVDNPSTVNLDNLKKHLRGRVTYLETRLRAFENGTFSCSPAVRAQYSQTLQVVQAELAAVETAPIHFGSVLCTSSLSTYSPSENHLARLDWGLVVVDDLRLPHDQENIATVSFELPRHELTHHNCLPSQSVSCPRSIAPPHCQSTHANHATCNRQPPSSQKPSLAAICNATVPMDPILTGSS